VRCACRPGYDGEACDRCAAGFHRDGEDCTADEACAEDACGRRGQCAVAGGVAFCTCAAGYTGDDCERCYPGYHRDETGACALDEQCLPGLCGGRGSCTDDGGVAQCACEPAYTGPLCEHCAQGHHRDGAACVTDETCPDGACSRHGVCAVTLGVAACACIPGYTGAECDECAAGYHARGVDCAPDETCRASTCSGHGECRVVEGVAECRCDLGYVGAGCATCYPGYVFDAAEDGCVLLCPRGYLRCDGDCVPSNGTLHCGACNVACVGAQQCLEGTTGARCVCPAEPGFAECNGVCRHLATDADHCGECDNACDTRAGETCAESACCPRGQCQDLPDLRLDETVLRDSLHVTSASFAADNCALREGCVDAPGNRRLVRFTTMVGNFGTADLFIGSPFGNPRLEFSACHGHYHFNNFAEFRLLDQGGNVVARGHKQAFCLTDIQPVVDNPPPRRFGCDFQGITRGWADVYHSELDCQWVDISGAPAGDYVVEVIINPARVIAESNYENNRATAPLRLTDDPNFCSARDEVCGDGRDQDCDGVPDDGCPALTGNDTCETAHPVGSGGVFTAEIDAATVADVNPACAAAAGGDLFFRIDLPIPEIVYASTYGSTLDTVLSVRRDPCERDDLEVLCADDGCNEVGEHVVDVFGAGTWYFAVKAKVAGATGTVRLNVQRAGCAEAAPALAAGSYDGNTSGAGNDTAPGCGRGGGPDQLWYFTSCPGPTAVEASTCGALTRMDTVLELRAGSCLGAALPGACDDDDNACPTSRLSSRIATTLPGDGLWFLLVDGFGGNDAGPYTLTVEY
jgi:hypothetical protein